jgi:histidinol-phosphate aminotransferase
MARRAEEAIREDVRAMAAYHVPDAGGMVKLDAMENPYSLPQAVRAEIAAAVADAGLNRYPDAGATRLKAELRASFAIPSDMDLVLGNGSDELIQMIIMATAAPGAVVLAADPTFVMFRVIAALLQVRYVGVPLAADFELDAAGMLEAVRAHQPRVVFLAYPNNPTGNLFDAAAIERIVRAAPGLVVIDEAYYAFAQRTFMSRLSDYPHLMVMRTLSKSGLAGLRLGWVAGRHEVLAHIDKVRLPYNIGVLTQRVAGEVLRRQPLLEEQAAAVRRERARLYAALSTMSGVTAYPSEANFILFRVSGAPLVSDGLMRQGILIKNLHGSHPALENCLRVTVGTPDENERFLGALRELAGS